MWGAAQLGRWKWHDPWVHADLLAQNNSRIWVWSPKIGGASDPAAMIGQSEIAQGTNLTFYQQYRNVGGHNGHFDFPGGGDNGWGSWTGQLGAMSGDIVGRHPLGAEPAVEARASRRGPYLEPVPCSRVQRGRDGRLAAIC